MSNSCKNYCCADSPDNFSESCCGLNSSQVKLLQRCTTFQSFGLTFYEWYV